MIDETLLSDTVLPIISLQKDGVHPDTKGYRAIANSTRVK